MRPCGLVWQLQANLTLIEADRESNVAYSKSLSTLHERLLVGLVAVDLLFLPYLRFFVMPMSLPIAALLLIVSREKLLPLRDLWPYLVLLACIWAECTSGCRACRRRQESSRSSAFHQQEPGLCRWLGWLDEDSIASISGLR